MAMQQADLDHLLNMVRVELPGASESAMKSMLFDVLTEFFRDSSSWLENISFDTTAQVTEYAVNPKDGGQLIGLAGVLDAQQFPQPALMATIGTITLQSVPNETNTFTATVIKNVTFPTSRDMVPFAPDWVLKRYPLAIKHGILGHMMVQPDKPYSNQAEGVFHLRKFAEETAIALKDVLHRNTMGAAAWTFPRQWWGSTQKGGIYIGNERSFANG